MPNVAFGTGFADVLNNAGVYWWRLIVALPPISGRRPIRGHRASLTLSRMLSTSFNTSSSGAWGREWLHGAITAEAGIISTRKFFVEKSGSKPSTAVLSHGSTYAVLSHGSTYARMVQPTAES